MAKKTKGGGTTKVCLPASKVKSMSKAERDKVVRANVQLLVKVNTKDLVNQMSKVLVKKEQHFVIGLKKKTGLM